VEMAHKVLSKDMSDLVNSMKLAQKYNNTTVEGDYRKYVIANPILTSNCSKFQRSVLLLFLYKLPAKRLSGNNFSLVFDLTLLQNSALKSGLSEKMTKNFFHKNEHSFISNFFHSRKNF
jgi:hypothetical protein